METTISNATTLVPVHYEGDRVTVLGRDLHQALESKEKYSDWIRRMLEYGFTENVDYTIFLVQKKNESDHTSGISRPRVEHQMTLDMAKEIAMVQRTSVGQKVRRYFIEVEKQHRENINQEQFHPQFPIIPDPRNEALLVAGQQSQILHEYFGVNLGIARAHALVLVERDYDIDLQSIKALLPPTEEPVDTLTPTLIATQVTQKTGNATSSRTVNIILKEMGFQDNPNRGWELTELGKQHGSSFPYERNGHSEFQIRWNREVVDLIIEHISMKK